MINLYLENLFLSNIVADSNPGVWSVPDPGLWSEPDPSVLIGFVSDCSDRIMLVLVGLGVFLEGWIRFRFRIWILIFLESLIQSRSFFARIRNPSLVYTLSPTICLVSVSALHQVRRDGGHTLVI